MKHSFPAGIDILCDFATSNLRRIKMFAHMARICLMMMMMMMRNAQGETHVVRIKFNQKYTKVHFNTKL